MDKLKQELFEATYYYRKEYKRLIKALGEWNSLPDSSLAKFRALYDVIVNSELEEEYLAWANAYEVKK